MNARALWLAAILAAIAIGGFGLAQQAATQPAATQPADGPHATFQDDLLGHLVGSWKLTRSIRGETVENSVKAEWALNHQFLKLEMRDVATPSRYEALILIGYIHAEQRYVIHWCDTYGGKYSALGSGRRNGDSIEFEFRYPDGPFFNTFTWNAKAATWTFLMQSVDADGKRQLFAEDTLKRSES